MAERESIRERRSKPRAVPAIGTAGEADECSTENPLWLPVPSRPYSIAKRLIDIVFSILALILNAPILIAIALAIRLTSKGPILFRQTRLGYHAKPFTYFKFRTMHSSIEPDVHANYIKRLIAGSPPDERSDPSFTQIGRWLRRTSLDELPQFLSVLKGDMSLVGPRPPIPYEVEYYLDWHKSRLSCKPGITGPWQIRGGHVKFDDMVRMDIEYACNPSILRDLQILLRTPLELIRGDGAF